MRLGQIISTKDGALLPVFQRVEGIDWYVLLRQYKGNSDWEVISRAASEQGIMCQLHKELFRQNNG